MSADLENDTNETETDNSQMPEQTQPIQRLVGSTSLQVVYKNAVVGEVCIYFYTLH
jgi:hypothetical protein